MALLGGSLIGISATLLMLYIGRIAGISGIYLSIFTSNKADKIWRFLFIFGLLTGGFLSSLFLVNPFDSSFSPSLFQMAVAGAIVGLGTQLGSGCTSGHGVCGISRFSQRSIVATFVFIFSGVLTVWIMGV